MIHREVLGLEPAVVEENEQHYGWWVNAEPYWEPLGFEFSISFPRWPTSWLPAVTIQLWNHSYQIGWFF